MDDAQLVGLAIAGDTTAFGHLYDRYAGNVYGLARHMLRDEHEAADVTSDVFIIASQRLAQLREPARVRAWLFAIARNEVHRAMRRRKRTEVSDDLDHVADLPVIDTDAPQPDPFLAKNAVLEAAAGLDDRDRMVLELSLAGVQGDDLSSALGVTTANAYQLHHRMKERLERSLGALLVARQGRADCPDLEALLEPWDGTFSVLWRKRVARHVDKCDVCERRRKKAAAALLAGTALALDPARFAIDPPVELRRRILEAARALLGTSPLRRWPGGGWPPGGSNHRLRIAAAAAIVIALIGTGVVVRTIDDGSDAAEVATGGPTSTAEDDPASEPGAGRGSTTASSSAAPSSAGTAPVAPGGQPGDSGIAPVEPGWQPGAGSASTSIIIIEGPGGGGGGGGGSSGTIIVTPPPPPPPDTTPPSLSLSGPSTLLPEDCGSNPAFVVSATDNVGVTRVELRWRIVPPDQPFVADMIYSSGAWRLPVSPPAWAWYTTVYVTAVAYDAAGNQATSTERSAYVDCV